MLQEVLRTIFKRPELLCVSPRPSSDGGAPSSIALTLCHRRAGTSGIAKGSVAVSPWHYPDQSWGMDFPGLVKVRQLAQSSRVSHVALCLLEQALPTERCLRPETARLAILGGNNFVACGKLALDQNAHHPISDLCLSKRDMLVLLRFLAYARRTETLQKGEAAVLFESTEFIPYPLHNAIYPAPFFISRIKEIELMVSVLKEQESEIAELVVSSVSFSHSIAAYLAYAFSTTTQDSHNVHYL